MKLKITGTHAVIGVTADADGVIDVDATDAERLLALGAATPLEGDPAAGALEQHLNEKRARAKAAPAKAAPAKAAPATKPGKKAKG